MNNLNIVLATDNQYIIPCMVTISSILSSAKTGTTFNFIIICPKELSHISRQKIASIEEKFEQASVSFLEIDDTRLNSAVMTAHVSAASYYRLFISSLIPYDRCLYIDCDMIVTEDLTEVYNTELDGYYAAGVKDMGVQCHFSEYEEYAGYLDIPDMYSYVNAGFMVFNLGKIRDDGIGCKMINLIDKGYQYMDQDIINRLFYGKIKLIPLKYDFFTEYVGSMPKQNLSGYTLEELKDIGQRIAVYHFAGVFKPWVCTRLAVNRIWWDEAGKILDGNTYRNVLEQAHEFEMKSDWVYIAKAAADKKQIVVFGCSPIGLKVAGGLEHSRTGQMIVFADNDFKKIGKTVGGFPVLSAEEAYSKYPNALYVISSQNGFKQIGAQLADLGVNAANILRYVHKGETYYNRLDASFVEYEQKLVEMFCNEENAG